METAVPIGKFTAFFILYTLMSGVAHLSAAFTGAAWLVYFFTLLPFYAACILYVLSYYSKNRLSKLRLKRLPLSLGLLFQILTILVSPASCYGWHQGNSCYTLAQTYLGGQSLVGFMGDHNGPAHWSLIEGMFPVALIAYLIAVGVFLKTIAYLRGS